MQLTFQPAFDPYHAVFRIFRLKPLLEAVGDVPVDIVRILDFYLTFPFRSGSIRLKPTHARFRRLSVTYQESQPYGGLPDDKLLFDRMEPIQLAALQTLGAQGYLDSNLLGQGSVKATETQPPERVRKRVKEQNEKEKDLLEFLKVLSTEYPLLGENGLKDRTQLMEYRYDAV